MKVLMFGWEFPPHISGGLGTACFGLTGSLARLETAILFVIPKADNETAEERLKIISAHNIDIPVSTILKHRIQNQRKTAKNKNAGSHRNIEVIRVNAELPPYTSQDVLSGAVPLTTWNYQFSEASSSSTYLESGRTIEPVTARYPFSGSYGVNLLEEVAAYGLAGAEIAKQNEFDIIHAHDWLTYTAGIEAQKISGKPLVVHVHATEFDRAGNNMDKKIFKMEREGMEAADRVIAVSQWTKNILVSRYSIPASKISVVHNGAQPARQKYKAASYWKTDNYFFGQNNLPERACILCRGCSKSPGKIS